MSRGGPWDFDGKVALVTGASRGIGLAVAETLAAAGASVAITARKQPELDEALERLGDHAIAIRGGADQPGHPEEVVRTTVERFGRLDFLVNNAATNPQFGPLHEAELGAVDKVFAVDLRAPLVFVQEAWKAAMAADGGGIVNVGSIGGIRVAPNLGAYHTAKAGLLYMTKQLAHDMAPAVRVNAVAPAVIRTKMATALYEGVEKPGSHYPLRRIGEPEEVAEAIAFLLSDRSAWITGEVIVLDGGLSLNLQQA